MFTDSISWYDSWSANTMMLLIGLLTWAYYQYSSIHPIVCNQIVFKAKRHDVSKVPLPNCILWLVKIFIPIASYLAMHVAIS